jgi:hypothetical protein
MDASSGVFVPQSAAASLSVQMLDGFRSYRNCSSVHSSRHSEQECGRTGPKVSSTHAALAWYSVISPPTTRRRWIWCIGTGVGITPIVSGA